MATRARARVRSQTRAQALAQVQIDHRRLLDSLALYVRWRGNEWATWVVLEGKNGRYV